MDEVKKIKEQIKVIREKGDKYTQKAKEQYDKIKKLEERITEIENEEKLKVASKQYIILDKLGFTMEDLTKALENGDLLSLQEKIEATNKSSVQKEETRL